MHSFWIADGFLSEIDSAKVTDRPPSWYEASMHLNCFKQELTHLSAGRTNAQLE